MTQVFQFALLGLGAGAVYALLGQGLVLIYRGSGILNLAHGAFAMAGAYLYYELHVKGGHSLALSMVVAVAALVLLGIITDQLLLRRLRSASGVAQLIATLGVLLVVQSIASLRYGVQPTLVDPLLPAKPVTILGATISSDRLWLFVIAVGLTGAMTMLWRYTRAGWVMSAVSENPRAAAALGWSPEFVSAATWGFGAGLAALAGILVAPITQLTVTGLTLTLIPALAAALIGGFVSFPLTLAGGVLIGVAESEVGRYVNVTGATDALPLLVIVGVLLLRGSALPLRGYVSERLPEIGLGRIRARSALVGVALGLLMIGFVLNADWLAAAIVYFSVAIILLSLVVLTGYSGQLSLAQFALAGVGALLAARLVQSEGLPFPVALLLGVLGATVVGMLFALPSFRTRGIELAIVTLGLGDAAQALLFNNASVTSSVVGTPVGSPHLLGLDVDALNHPVRYTILVFVMFVLCVLGVANLRRGRSGRRLLAVRTNERAAAAGGISVFSAKLHAFALAGALAGLGGVLLGFRGPYVIYDGFDPLTSINGILEAVIGGIGYVLGPLFGSFLAPGSLGQQLSGNSARAAEYLPLVSGVMLLVLLVAAPNGLAHAARAFRARLDRYGRTPKRQASIRLPEREQRPVRVEPYRLEVAHLSVRYGAVVAVDDVGFSVAPGEVVGLIGPNGAGKTSVVDAVSGFTRARGTVMAGGQDISGWSAHRRARLGLVRSFQSLELFEDMTVFENLQAVSEERDSKAILTDLVRPGLGVLSDAAVAAVQEFGLEDVLDRRPGELSYGRRRLVAIARSIAMKPSILLLDEPVAGLDESETREFSVAVRRLADHWGIGILVIEHDMPFVMTICDRIVVMDFGRTIAEGTPEEIRTNRSAIAAYLGEESEVLPESRPEVGA